MSKIAEELKLFHHFMLSVHVRTPRGASTLTAALARLDYSSLFEEGALEVSISTAGLKSLHTQKPEDPPLRKPAVVLAYRGGQPVKAKIFSSDEAADAFLARIPKKADGPTFKKIPVS